MLSKPPRLRGEIVHKAPIVARFIAGVATVLVAAALPGIASSAAAPTSATDGPGALSHFDLARKDCLGTSRTTASSRAW